MVIKSNIYSEIAKKLACNNYEGGGIIGIKDNAISFFCYDKGLSHCKNYYIPNVDFLNITIEKWEAEGVDFCGIIHNHVNGCKELSKEDIEYALLIKNAMPDLKVLLFPILTVENDKTIITCYDVLNRFNVIDLIIAD